MGWRPSEEALQQNHGVSRRKEEQAQRVKAGGLLPRKRRLVKRMMFDYIAKKMASLLCSSSCYHCRSTRVFNCTDD
uniref:Uncharacterized protein n=1 Tax=Nelumbo nucifera TaxID=4432 RepID=A0A822Z5F2_NELNU|nr:TPA_asm: hypothetical protein HUJ06_014143 [Nelumbo nucifera]